MNDVYESNLAIKFKIAHNEKERKKKKKTKDSFDSAADTVVVAAITASAVN